jgi:hypothetical protein
MLITEIHQAASSLYGKLKKLTSSHQLQQALRFLFMGFALLSVQTDVISLSSVSQLIFVMLKCCVFFAVRTEFLNII